MFNILTVLVFLPLELVSHYLELLTGAIVGQADNNSTISSPDFLKALTTPFVSLIVQLDKENLKKLGISNSTNLTLLKHCPDEPVNKCILNLFLIFFILN